MPVRTRFERLGLFYILALSGIAMIIIASQVVVQNYIANQKNDSRIINIAGRQRMLSQKISKISLQMLSNQEEALYVTLNQKLEKALSLWVNSHVGLQLGDEKLGLTGDNSVEVSRMFDVVKPHYDTIVLHTQRIIESFKDTKAFDQAVLTRHVRLILEHEEQFLSGMNNIVFQYDKEAIDKVNTLERIEIALLGISLLIIVLELIFIFRPIAKDVKNTVQELMESEVSSKKMTREINKLYEELGKSYQDLEAVQFDEEQPLIFAKLNRNGEMTFFSESFRKLLGFSTKDLPQNLWGWMHTEGYNQDFLKGVMDLVRSGENWNGQVKLTSAEGDFFWFEMFVVPIEAVSSIASQILVLARDVTEEQEAKMRSREINREKIEKRVKEQQYRSVLILEGQEEERKRISREMHDGIGQMLTALKLNLEAITPSSSKHTKKRLEDTRSIMKNVIREVRRISFNLTPSSLNDFGIVPAIKKFCSEVSLLTDIELEFINKTRFINRLDSIVETNLYRIIQEAVNNAIKYSKTEKITVIFEHNFNNLNIEVTDNGKGFNYEKLVESGHFKASGHGIFNMRERAAFINASFEVISAIGEGTKIRISLPLN